MSFGTNDLRAFCRDMGVPVTYNGVSTYPDGQPVLGLFDRPVQNKLADQGFGGVDIGFPEVKLPFNAFTAMPRKRDTLIVAGTAYTVADSHAESDGGFICYELKL